MRIATLALATWFLALAASSSAAPPPGGPGPDDVAMPRYKHIFVIMGENKDWDRIDGSTNAPRLTRLAQTYGDATRFYGEVHPSEANYVALLGGSTFGIHDDDAYYCTPGTKQPSCGGAGKRGYVAHRVDAPHIGSQLEAVGLTWKSYNQSIPAPGSLAVYGSDPAEDGPHAPALYASKHTGFINFASVLNDPHRAELIVGYPALRRDIASGNLPNFGLIVPNLCDDMHGVLEPGVPSDCLYLRPGALIQRGDKAIANLVDMIQATPAWRSRDNVAIVITFDEDDRGSRAGCCGVTPDAPSNFGGGHIATIVITNHGPRGATDPTPYNHYSLLRTIEDAFGIHDYLNLAAATAQGVKPMLPLFKTR